MAPMKLFLTALLLLPTTACFSCKKSNGPLSKPDLKSKIVAAAKANHIPSLSVLLKRGNQKLAFEYKDKNNSIQQISTYGIASTTKLLATVLIMKYAERKEIELDAPITKYINKAELPQITWIDSIKVRNLLNNTSGIADYTHNPLWITLIQTGKTAKTFKEKIALASVIDSTLAFGRFSYSNTNFVILEKILETVSKQNAFAVFNTFYADLGLINTSFNTPRTGTQAFYALTGDASSDISNYDEGYGFEGGAYSTTADLTLFLQKVFVKKTILNAQSLAAMQHWTDMDKFKINYPNARIADYGLGLMKYETAGRTFIGHPGSSLKYQSFAFIDPATDTEIILLSNCSGKYFNKAFLLEIIDNIVSKNLPL
ncbi:MAG: serine hydrolase domain-containing protein [Pelobium sp.]